MFGRKSAVPYLHLGRTLELSVFSYVLNMVLLQVTIIDAIQTLDVGIAGLFYRSVRRESRWIYGLHAQFS